MFTIVLLGLALATTDGAEVAEGQYFTIKVVDDETGRGVPLVELRTVNNISYYTDSNGIVAFYQPGLMDQVVFFHVKSHGYEFPEDGFGFRGKALKVVEGGMAELKIKRINIAQRLYRVTGGGIYRDSTLVGHAAPIKNPLLNARVFGSDSVVNAIFQGQIYWFWGDTNRPGYPLGNFHVPGATSVLPEDGGLDPEMGVDLNYFANERGFAKETCHMPGEGPTWITALAALTDHTGKQRLFAHFVKVRKFLEVYQRGLAEFNPAIQQFEKVTEFELDAPIHPGGHPFEHVEDGTAYLYFANPLPWVRVPADVDHLAQQSSYQAYTCLKEGSRPGQLELERDANGRLQYRWRNDAPLFGPEEMQELIETGGAEADEAAMVVRDVHSGERVRIHRGSVYWNRFRNRWVMIVCQTGGSSLLGELWYAEGDHPEGPWLYAVKILTHEKYSFYNPKQHPMFDKHGGRTIFFEGTYTSTFSGNPVQTPWYDYNQIMYKLDLSDPRLVLPVPVYHLGPVETADRFGTKGRASQESSPGRIAFFALDQKREGAVPVYEYPTSDGGRVLKAGKPGTTEPNARGELLFYALSRDLKEQPPGVVPLYEFVSASGKRAYSTEETGQAADTRGKQVLCHVWSGRSIAHETTCKQGSVMQATCPPHQPGHRDGSDRASTFSLPPPIRPRCSRSPQISLCVHPRSIRPR